MALQGLHVDGHREGTPNPVWELLEKVIPYLSIEGDTYGKLR